MKHTKGEWIENPIAKGNIIAKETERYIASCMGYSSNVNPDEIIEENLANAKLITEAGTVTNETGYTPRQLAEQKAELLKALIKIVHIDDELCKCPACKIGKPAIKNATP